MSGLFPGVLANQWGHSALEFTLISQLSVT